MEVYLVAQEGAYSDGLGIVSSYQDYFIYDTLEKAQAKFNELVAELTKMYGDTWYEAEKEEPSGEVVYYKCDNEFSVWKDGCFCENHETIRIIKDKVQ